VRRLLIPHGVKVRQYVELRRDWYWLAVVVPRSGVLEAQWIDTLGCEDFLPILRDWQRAGIDIVVWDGLPGHRGVPPTETPIPTILQPAASPEQDLTERVGEEIRAAVKGLPYATLWTKMMVVEVILH